MTSDVFYTSLIFFWHMLRAVVAGRYVPSSRYTTLQVRLTIVQSIALLEFAFVLTSTSVDVE